MSVDAISIAAGRPTRTAWALAALALAATVVALYLAVVAWHYDGLPVGCGEDSGCAEVLSSRWSGLLGIPVAVLGVGTYLLTCWAAVRPAWTKAPWILCLVAAVLLSAALWFLFLQVVVLRAICPWCVAEHLLGIAIAVMSIGQARASRRFTGRTLWSATLVGVLGVAVLALLQSIQAERVSFVRLADTGMAVSGGDGVNVHLLQGRLTLDPHAEPRLGDAAAPLRVYLMFDYCCPHCRRVHQYLLDALAAQPQRFCLICLPMPRDADCNPLITQTQERFEHACELALLALAVWQTRPEAFAEFDRWLFAPSQPPSPAAAQARAEQLVAPELLGAALKHSGPQRRLARNIQAFNDSQIAYLPVIMSPGMDTIVGRPESREALLQVLERDLFRTAPHASTSPETSSDPKEQP
jgi:uncharacterized membrane protein